MSYSDALTRVSLIEQQLAALRTGNLASVAAAAGSSASSTAASSSGTSATAFADALAQAQGTSASDPTMATEEATPDDGSLTGGTAFTSTASALSPSYGGLSLVPSTGLSIDSGGAALPSTASGMLTSDQQTFASTLAARTGLNPGVVCAWLLAEESGGAAQSRQAAGNNDWLNIGYTDSATYGSSDSVWSDPVSAADVTAGWLKGQDTIPGYGTASQGIQGILNTVGSTPAAQIAALQGSGWASSGYPDLPALYSQVTG